MNVIFSLHPMRVLLAILSFALALPAQAVQLSSGEKNNSYIGVANYAFSYTSNPLVLSGYCTIPPTAASTDKVSSFLNEPENCDTSTSASCWADTCTDGNAADCTYQYMGVTHPVPSVQVESSISLNSMRKTLLLYYADNHTDTDQGFCNFNIGTYWFGISFDYQNTGSDFSLALYAQTPSTPALPCVASYDDETGGFCNVSNSNGWTTSGPCPNAPFTARSGSDYVSSQYNLICNEQYVVSLAADPSVSHGAIISVVNTQGSLPSGSQELSADAPVASQQAFNGSSSAEQGLGKGVIRTATPLNPSNQSIAASASAAEGLRRLSNQAAGDRRWLVTSDAEGKEVHGVLLSGPPPHTTDLVACQLGGDDGNLDPVQSSYSYDCDLVSLDGTSNRKEVITVPGSVLRPRLLQAPLAEGRATRVRATNRDVPSRINVAISDFAKGARLASPDGSKNLVWHGIGTTSRVVMVKRELEDIVEVVTHSPEAKSPMFMSCSGANEGRALNPVYACTANLRCIGSPCPSASWSTVSNLTLPTALFKNRPCQPGNGTPSLNPFLEVKSSVHKGPSGQLAFHSGIVLPADSDVRPDKTGFRLLVQDANGRTVVDVDVPGNKHPFFDRTQPDQSHKRQRNTWKVSRNGRKFTFRSTKIIGGAIPNITIELAGRRGNEWLVDVRGSVGRFDAADLSLPLEASLTLNPADQNSALCSATEFDSSPDSGSIDGTCTEKNDRPDKSGAKIVCR